MMRIWKFPLKLEDEQEVDMPSLACVLCVQVQDEIPCLWALVDEACPHVRRIVHIRGTGHIADGMEMAQYVGTFQLLGGIFVGHVFADVEAP